MIKILLLNIISLITGVDSIGAMPEATLLFVGDAMQHQAQIDKAFELGERKEYSYEGCFDLIAPEITNADYAVCNLEVPLGGGPDYSGYPCFNAPDSFAEALKSAGFDMMLTANNHCLDRRDKAAKRTLVFLDSLGIDHIGTYKDSLQRKEKIPFIKDINGFKIGFLNYTYGTNGILPKDGTEICLIDTIKIKEEIQKTREAGAEIIVAAMHWGIEYVLIENQIQRNLADFLSAQGVELIIGGHPHVIQPMKREYNKKTNKETLTVFSLGNFISNMKTADTRGGAMIKIKLSRDEKGEVFIKDATYDLLFAAKPDKENNFRVIPGWMEDKIPLSQIEHWHIFERGAKRIFDKYNVNIPQTER